MPSSFPDPMRSEPLRHLLSSAADGEADAGGLRASLQAWQDDSEARACWHEYHLIGDVLRNEELARPAQADEAFLHALRARLANEPRILAPMPLAAEPVRRRLRWVAPAAAAAAFMGLATVLVVSRLGGGAAGGPAMALAPASAAVAAAPVGGDAVLANGLVREPGGQLLRRDERLDAYLRAHRDTSADHLPWTGASVRSTSSPMSAPGR